MSRVNLKKSAEFKVGEFARSRAWGTRIYKVLQVFEGFVTKGTIGNPYTVFYTYVTLSKVAETNRGVPQFCNGRPFTIETNGSDSQWYYPAKASPNGYF